MKTQMTVKESIQKDFDTYMKAVEAKKLTAKVDGLELFKTEFDYGQDVLEIRPFVDAGIVMVTIHMGYYGSATGYHAYGSPETYSLKKAIEVIEAMKTGLGETVYQPQYSGYQMGLTLEHIKTALQSI
jgi:hypothetical protein